MQQRIIKMMVTRFTVCSMIQSRVETIVLVKQMFIVWQRFLTALSINVLRKVFLLLASMEVCWITVLSEVRKYLVLSMQKVKQVNNFCWVPIQH